jgi:ketosteroid isomerase-like protein
MDYKPAVLFNRISIAASLFLILCLLFTNCSSDRSPDIKEIEETLRNADASIQHTITQKNIDSLISFYAEDAFLLPTAEPIVKGKAAIKKEWQHIFQIPDFNNKSTLNKIEISEDGGMAYTMGSYLATMQGEDGNPVQEPGKWVTIWKKQPNGRWRIIVDTYNTDVPPPDHK